MFNRTELDFQKTSAFVYVDTNIENLELLLVCLLCGNSALTVEVLEQFLFLNACFIDIRMQNLLFGTDSKVR